MKDISVHAWYRVHKWTSLLCTLFLLMLCVTGLPLIFGDEIDALTRPEIAISDVPEATPDASLDRIVALARARYPGEFIRFMTWDKEQPKRVRINLSASPDVPAAQGHEAVFDTRTMALLGEVPKQDGVMQKIQDLHQNMFLGLPGDLTLSVVGLLFLASIVSGVMLYGPFMRKQDFGVVRRDRSPRLRWLDLHNLLSVAALLWLLVVGATGLMNTLSKPLFGLWSMQEMPRLLAAAGKSASSQAPSLRELAPLDAIVANTHAAVPDKRISGLVFPSKKFGSPHHFVLWTLGDTPLTSRMFTPVLVDATSGKVAAASTLPWYLKALELSRPLHFGDYGGLPLKILWALFDLIAIAVLVSGLYLWWARRKGVEKRLAELGRSDTIPANGNIAAGEN